MLDTKTRGSREMTEKNEAKKPIREIEDDEEIEKDRQQFNDHIKKNDEIAMTLQEHSDKFKPKPNIPPAVPTMQNFLSTASLHKQDHGETLRMIQHLAEVLIQLEKGLTTRLQDLEDNIQAISIQTDTKISKIKSSVGEAKQYAVAIHELWRNLVEEQGMNQEGQEYWKKLGEGKLDYIA